MEKLLKIKKGSPRLRQDANGNRSLERGFTLAELLISLAILAVVGTAVSTFQSDIFTLAFSSQANLSAQLDARHIIRQIVTELREASPSSLGAYPVAVAATSSITFFSDIDNDGLTEQIRYFLSGKTLMKGIITPSGSPLAYPAGNEKISTVIGSVINGTSTPIFLYYNSSYAGTTSPLVDPVIIPSVRLVKVNILIDKDPNKSPNPINVTTQVMIRNLKDNY